MRDGSADEGHVRSSVRVTLVEPFFHRAGHFSEEVVQLGRSLADGGADVEVVTPRPAFVPGLKSRAAGVPAYLARASSGPLRAVLDTVLIWRCMVAAVRSSDPQSVTVCVSGRFLAFFMVAAWMRGRALVFFDRDFSQVQQPSLVDRLLHAPTRWLARIGGTRNAVSLVSIVDPRAARPKDAFGLPSVYIPPVGVVRTETARPDKAEARRRLGLPPDEPILLVFGFAHPGKDYGVVFEALAHVEQPLRVVFAGSVPSGFAEHPRALKASRDPDDRVIVRDAWIPREEVPFYFAAADGLLLSYRAGYLVDSGVLCQGVAMGLPMVGNREGSIGQAVVRWRLGLTFEAGQPADLARQMTTLVNLSRHEAQAMAGGRERFCAHYSWERIAADHIALYRCLLDGAPPVLKGAPGRTS